MAVLSVVVLVSTFVQGSSGIGFALIVAPIFALIDQTLNPVVPVVLMIPLNAFVAIRERHALDRAGVLWISLGRLPGALLGLWLLVIVSAAHLNLLVGISTLLAALLTLFAPRFAPGRVGYLLSGTLSGTGETAAGIGGPPLALLYQHRPPAVLRTTVALCGLIGEVITLGVLSAAGRVDEHQLLTALFLLPAVTVGMLLSNLVHRRLSGRVTRYVVMAFAVASGLVLIVF